MVVSGMDLRERISMMFAHAESLQRCSMVRCMCWMEASCLQFCRCPVWTCANCKAFPCAQNHTFRREKEVVHHIPCILMTTTMSG